MKFFTYTYNFIDFLEPSKDWLKCNGDLNNKLFWTDHLHLSKLGNKKIALSVFTLLQEYKLVSTYPKFVPVSSVICKSFVSSQRVYEIDPPCYFTVNVSTVKNGKYLSSCYNVTSVTKVLQSKCLWSNSDSCWCCSCDRWCHCEALEWNILIPT